MQLFIDKVTISITSLIFVKVVLNNPRTLKRALDNSIGFNKNQNPRHSKIEF